MKLTNCKCGWTFCTPTPPCICCGCAVDSITCRKVPFSSTICCITCPCGTCTGIAIGGVPLCDTIGTVTGPGNRKKKKYYFKIFFIWCFRIIIRKSIWDNRRSLHSNFQENMSSENVLQKVRKYRSSLMFYIFWKL